MLLLLTVVAGFTGLATAGSVRVWVNTNSGAASAASAPRGLASLPAASAGTKVWVNSSSSVYHCPGSRYYGATQRGRYMSEPEAIASGNRPAYGARC